MIKNLKSATILGLILWVLIAVEIALVDIVFAPLGKNIQQILWLIFGIPIILFVANRYFKKNPGDVKDGLVLGAWLIFISIILDMTIGVPLFFDNDYSKYWSSMVVYGAFAAIMIGTTIAAQITKKEQPTPTL